MDLLLAGNVAPVIHTAKMASLSTVAQSPGDAEQPRAPRGLLENPTDDPTIIQHELLLLEQAVHT
jgi:hypothetical protein